VERETSPALEPTNERMIPESSDALTFWEHVYRYAFASHFVKGKRVLDIACGEGYGAAALQQAGAAPAIGVDISEAVCLHARDKYQIDARPGTAEQIPLADNSVDVVVSFETIEHVANPDHFLDECRRVLTPGGRLIISTPNKGVYTYAGGVPNPYHCSEMTEEQFALTLGSRFRNLRFYTQRPSSAAWWSARALVSEDSPWKRVRGFSRLRRLVQAALVPEAVKGPTDEQRRSVPNLILRVSRSPHQLLSPFALRRRREWTREKPTYVIAMAIR
jgi:SAM-dependent methyltransferase